MLQIYQVPIEAKSLNKSDAFILDIGSKIYQWCPPGTNRVERMKANTYAKKIRDDDHSGKPAVELLGLIIFCM